MLFFEVHRDNATYNCPCVKTGVRKFTPTYFSDCPCDLFIVIAKASLTGNCLHENLDPNPSSGPYNVIHGMKAILSASSTFGPKMRTSNTF